MMTVIFLIKDKFVLTTRNYFVLRGIVSEGYINGKRNLLCKEKGINVKIDSVEIINSSEDIGITGLLIKFKNEEELRLLNSLNSDDHIIII